MIAPLQKAPQEIPRDRAGRQCGELLSWDLETYLPAKGVDFRAEQLAHLERTHPPALHCKKGRRLD